MLLAEALRSPGLRKSELMLPIPAPNGVFMATLCSEQPLVNVRTFIRDSQLSERQLALEEKLARAMRADEHALLECIAAELRVPEASFALSMVLSRVARISQEWLGTVMTRITCRNDRHKNRDVYRRDFCHLQTRRLAARPVRPGGAQCSVGGTQKT
jgi:hypothetical protein